MPPLDPHRMRRVQWSSSIQWSVHFLKSDETDPRIQLPPEPFADWVPATEVEENIFTLNNHSYEAYMSSYEFPMTSAVFDVNVTFVDDERSTFHEWLADWVNNGILRGGEGLTPIKQSVLQMGRGAP